MGTLLEPPLSAHSSNTTSRPRPIIPIVPAIPRSLLATRKYRSVAKQPDDNPPTNRTPSSIESSKEYRDSGEPLIVNGSAQYSESEYHAGAKEDHEPRVVTGSAVCSTPRLTEVNAEGKFLRTFHLP